jgi:Zn-finger nucleic acid-binding protein
MSDSPYRSSQRPEAAPALPRRCLGCGDAVVGQYCRRCGTEATPSSVHGDSLVAACPRCATLLRPIGFEGGAVLRCPECAGALVTPADWSALIEDEPARTKVLAEMVPPLPGHALPEESLRAFVRCPLCRRQMDRYRFAALTDITVDACGEHGIWFDARELLAALRRVRAREEASATGKRLAEDEEAEREWAAHLSSIEHTVAMHAHEEEARARGALLPRDADLGFVLGTMLASLIRR